MHLFLVASCYYRASFLRSTKEKNIMQSVECWRADWISWCWVILADRVDADGMCGPVWLLCVWGGNAISVSWISGEGGWINEFVRVTVFVSLFIDNHFQSILLLRCVPVFRWGVDRFSASPIWRWEDFWWPVGSFEKAEIPWTPARVHGEWIAMPNENPSLVLVDCKLMQAAVEWIKRPTWPFLLVGWVHVRDKQPSPSQTLYRLYTFFSSQAYRAMVDICSWKFHPNLWGSTTSISPLRSCAPAFWWASSEVPWAPAARPMTSTRPSLMRSQAKRRFPNRFVSWVCIVFVVGGGSCKHPRRNADLRRVTGPLFVLGCGDVFVLRLL